MRQAIRRVELGLDGDAFEQHPQLVQGRVDPVVALGDQQWEPAGEAVASLRPAHLMGRDVGLGSAVGLLPETQVESVRDPIRTDERPVCPAEADLLGRSHALRG